MSNTNSNSKFTPSFKVIKPGCAMQLDNNCHKGYMFLTLANPIGKTQDGKNNVYGWTKQGEFIGVKLGFNDLIALQMGLEGKPLPEAVNKNALVNLYHRDPKNNNATLINLSKRDDRYTLRISRSKDEQFFIELSISELRALKGILTTFVPMVHKNPVTEMLKFQNEKINDLNDLIESQNDSIKSLTEQVSTLSALVAELVRNPSSIAS